MFLRTEELKRSVPELICVSLAQCCLQQCWAFHRSLVAPCNLLPDAPSASRSAVLRSIFPSLIPLCVLKVPVWMYLSCLSPSPTRGRSHPRRFPAHSRKRDCSSFSQLPCAVKAPTKFYLVRLINHLHSFETRPISSFICLFSRFEKSIYSQEKKQNPNKKKNTNPKPNPSSPTKPRNNSLLRLFWVAFISQWL